MFDSPLLKQLATTNTYLENTWNSSILPNLIEYIKIPNKSPAFDANWKANGHMDQAMALIKDWCAKQPIEGMSLKVLELPEKTPLLFIEIQGQLDETILLYGHMDKQPEMTGWHPDLGPWKPVLKDGKLYGRGGADDGYAVFASLTSIALLQQAKIPHARCVIIIEGSEESGSVDLPFYLSQLEHQIGEPTLVICLDSGCGNYDQLWLTTSLRGLVGGTLTIEVLSEGIHSGMGSGVVPSPFMILRQLLARIENEKNAEILLKELQVAIPSERVNEAHATGKAFGDHFFDMYPLLPGVSAVSDDIGELILNRSWRPELSVIGIDGFPEVAKAGNVTVPGLAVSLSMRLPPTGDADSAFEALKKVLEKDPPFNAKIHFTRQSAATGWHATPLAPWLDHAVHQASEAYFGNKAAFLGEGGTIPFIGMLQDRFPQAQFVVTGVLGPQSNAHGPNEFLHIATAKKLTSTIALIIGLHGETFSQK